MSTVNSLPSERVALVGVVAPASQSAATHDTGWIPVKNYRRFMAVVNAGVIGASGTIDLVLRTSTDLVGGGPQTITDAAIPQMVKATDDGKSAVLNVNTDSLLQNVQSVSFRLTVGTAASLADLAVYGFDAYSEPASDNQSSTVKTITSY